MRTAQGRYGAQKSPQDARLLDAEDTAAIKMRL